MTKPPCQEKPDVQRRLGPADGHIIKPCIHELLRFFIAKSHPPFRRKTVSTSLLGVGLGLLVKLLDRSQSSYVRDKVQYNDFSFLVDPEPSTSCCTNTFWVGSP